MLAFSDDLVKHGGDPKNIKEVVIDMSPAFISAVLSVFTSAMVTCDTLSEISDNRSKMIFAEGRFSLTVFT
ncbi:MAG: transposase [Deltaproteobacteria bacterium]|nr:transposase [Deltaproteobacteria bacterium]